MKRASILFVILFILLVMGISSGSLSGCGVRTETVQEKITEISLWYSLDQEHEKHELKKLVDNFNKSQDRMRVRLQYVPGEDFKKRLALSMADGTMPELSLIDSAQFQYFHAMQPFAELTDRIEELEGYIPQTMQSCMIDGKVYGLPFGFSCSILYYNKTILEYHGMEVPDTWEELLETAVALSDGEHYGFALPIVRSEESTYNFLPFLWSGGGDVHHLDSEESRKAFAFLRSLAESGAVDKRSTNLTAGDLVIQFAEGNIVMMINSSAMMDSIAEQNPELDFGVAPPPKADENADEISALGGAAVFGVACGEYEEEAITFLRYVSEKEYMQEYMCNFSFMAPRKDVLESQFIGDVRKEKVLDIARISKNRELLAEWPYISEIITDAMKQEIIGEQEETEILSEAAEKIRELEGR